MIHLTNKCFFQKYIWMWIILIVTSIAIKLNFVAILNLVIKPPAEKTVTTIWDYTQSQSATDPAIPATTQAQMVTDPAIPPIIQAQSVTYPAMPPTTQAQCHRPTHTTNNTGTKCHIPSHTTNNTGTNCHSLFCTHIYQNSPTKQRCNQHLLI